MAELAWVCANQILLEAGNPETTQLAVGVKGVIQFGAIYTGTPDGSGEPLGGIRSKAKGSSDQRRLYRYYYEPTAKKLEESESAGESKPKAGEAAEK